MQGVSRIHHVSAIGGNGSETVAFYRDVLKMKLLKATVNFADESTYHLFFGSHGTESKGAMTYFDWRSRHEGKRGGGQGGHTAFRVPKDTLAYWKEHLQSQGIETRVSKLFGKETLEFEEPHGIPLALVEGEEEKDSYKIYDFHGAEFFSTDYQATAKHFIDVLALKAAGQTDTHLLFDTVGEDKHRLIIPKENMKRRMLGRGTIDHIALDIGNKTNLDNWRTYLDNLGIENRDLTNQNYSKATYYREPGNVRIELATQGLGMMTELESSGELGTEVVIPKHLKDREAEILAKLPPLEL